MVVAAAKKPKKEDKPAAAPAPEPAAEERAVVYPQLKVGLFHDGDGGQGHLTVATAKDILVWKDEDDYKAENNLALDTKLGKGPGCLDLETSIGPPHFYDVRDKAVWCWAMNTPDRKHLNRPFDRHWALAKAQDILTGKRQLTGQTIMVVGKTGIVTDGNHTAVGLVFAAQQLQLEPERWPLWTEADGSLVEPFIEGIITFGAPENKATLDVMDFTKPRSDDDAIFTSDIYSHLNTAGRKEASRMLAKATDVVWRRTCDGNWGRIQYMTNAMKSDFRDRHPNLLKCVKHLLEENGGAPKDGKTESGSRNISRLGFSAGEAAGLMYLMACSSSKPEAYRIAAEPGDAALNFANWKKAEAFWSHVALTSGPIHKVVKAALNRLTSDDGGGVGNAGEKTAILVKAWLAYLTSGKVTEDDLLLSESDGDYAEKNGKRRFVGNHTVGGIDANGRAEELDDENGDPPITPEEAEANKAAIRKAQEDAVLKARNGEPAPSATIAGPGQGKPPKPLLLDVPLHKRGTEKPPAKPVKAAAKPKGKVTAKKK